MSDINEAMIFAAGFGKRMRPLTKEVPKPLLKVNGKPIIFYIIEDLINLNFKNIVINTHYLSDKFYDELKPYARTVKIIFEEEILDTGGGIMNLINHSTQNNFLVFNPDTFWSNKYLEEIQNMEKFYFANKLKDILLVVEKSKSFDQRMNGDFSLQNNILTKLPHKNFIFTGCQILNKSIFENHKIETFSINNIWEEMILKKQAIDRYLFQNVNHLTKVFKNICMKIVLKLVKFSIKILKT